MLKQKLYLKVTVAGRVEPTTGMVVNISDLKVCEATSSLRFKITFNIEKVWIQEVLKKIDHRNIDKEVKPFSEGQVSPCFIPILSVFSSSAG